MTLQLVDTGFSYCGIICGLQNLGSATEAGMSTACVRC